MVHLPKTSERVGHEFRVSEPRAKEVFLAGSFNKWNPKSARMRRNDDGVWTVTLQLAPGRHEYKFIVDGNWHCEDACEELHHECSHCVANDLGTRNSVLEIESEQRPDLDGSVPKERKLSDPLLRVR